MLHFQLFTLKGLKFDDDVYEVVLPTLEGQIGVLQNHMPLVSVATVGVITIRHQPHDRPDQLDHYAAYGGVIEVANNTLRVLVDEADHTDEINEAEAQKAMQLAQQMRAEAKDQANLQHAQSLIDRQAVRLHVAGIKRRRQRG